MSIPPPPHTHTRPMNAGGHSHSSYSPIKFGGGKEWEGEERRWREGWKRGEKRSEKKRKVEGEIEEFRKGGWKRKEK